jgi:hypothetical protein
MKTKILFLLFLLSSIISFSQTLEELKTETKKIYDANYYMVFEDIVNLSYPKIVESIGENAFLDRLSLDYENKEYRMRLQLIDPVFLYSALKKIEGKTFCVITYKNPVRFFYEDKLDGNLIAQKTVFLKEKNKNAQITFEPKRNSFNVRRNSKFIAICDETTQKQWRFFNMDDTSQKQLFQNFFNEVIKKELGL